MVIARQGDTYAPKELPRSVVPHARQVAVQPVGVTWVASQPPHSGQ